MLARDTFNAYCAALPRTTHVVQWGGADVWKLGGKVFAIAGWNDGEDTYTFKASEMAFEVLQDQPGIRPAPYMASRGLKWLQVHADPGLSDEELKAHIKASYDMIAEKLPRKTRTALGL